MIRFRDLLLGACLVLLLGAAVSTVRRLPYQTAQSSDHAATVTVINTATAWHAMGGNGNWTANKLNSWSFVDGTAPVAITVYATADAGAATTVTAAGHGLSDGDTVTIDGSTNYNSIAQVHTVSNVAGADFKIDVAFAGDDGAGNVSRGPYLLAGANAAGEYEIAWHMSSGQPGGGAQAFEGSVFVNATEIDDLHSHRKFGAGGDVGSWASEAIQTIAASDRVWMAVNNLDGTGNHTNDHLVLLLRRVQ